MTVEQYLFDHLSKALVLLSGLSAGLLLWPATWSRSLGVLICLGVVAMNFIHSRRVSKT